MDVSQYCFSTDTLSSQKYSHVTFESEAGVLRVVCTSTGYTGPTTLREYFVMFCWVNLHRNAEAEQMPGDLLVYNEGVAELILLLNYIWRNNIHDFHSLEISMNYVEICFLFFRFGKP